MELTEYQKEDKAFIVNPGKWPQWPYLPMKQSKTTTPGTLIDMNPLMQKVNKDHACFKTLFLTSIWHVAGGHTTFKDAEKKIYNTIDEMLADGWVVD